MASALMHQPYFHKHSHERFPGMPRFSCRRHGAVLLPSYRRLRVATSPSYHIGAFALLPSGAACRWAVSGQKSPVLRNYTSSPSDWRRLPFKCNSFGVNLQKPSVHPILRAGTLRLIRNHRRQTVSWRIGAAFTAYSPSFYSSGLGLMC